MSEFRFNSFEDVALADCLCDFLKESFPEFSFEVMPSWNLDWVCRGMVPADKLEVLRLLAMGMERAWDSRKWA